MNNLYYDNIKTLLQHNYIYIKNFLLEYIPQYDIHLNYNEIIFKDKLSDCIFKKFKCEYIDFDCFEYANAPFILMNELSFNNLKRLQDKNNRKYLYYDKPEYFLEMLQVVDIVSIISNQDIVFLFGIEDLNKFFYNEIAQFPENYINVCNDIIKELNSIKINKIEFLKAKIDDYYNNKVLNNLRKDFKVLIIHKFTYYRYCEEYISAFKDSEIYCEITSDINDFSSSFDEYAFLNYILIYKPTALIVDNLVHKRFPYYINKNLIVISFLDHPVHLCADSNYLQNMGKYTFLIAPYLNLENYAISKKTFLSDPFKNNIIKIPFVCDHKEYINYKLDKTNLKDYTSDICIVASILGRFEYRIPLYYNLYFMNNIEDREYYDKSCLIFNTMISKVYEEISKKEELIWDIKWFKETLYLECKKASLEILNNFPDEFETYSKTIFLEIVPFVHRNMILKWLKEKKYDFKIWGRNPCEPNSIFRDNIKGYIKNTELVKVYNSSKICLNINPNLSLHRRTFETFLNNCFYLTCKVKEADISDIEVFFKKGISTDFYSNKKELYEKLDFYLKNSKIRNKMILAGKSFILEKGLYTDKIFKNVVEEVINRVENNFNKIQTFIEI